MLHDWHPYQQGRSKEKAKGAAATSKGLKGHTYVKYSGDLNTKPVRYLNGQRFHETGHPISDHLNTQQNYMAYNKTGLMPVKMVI